MAINLDQEILDASQDHIRKVVNGVKSMVQVIDAWLHGDETILQEKIELTQKYEQDADEVKQMMLKKTAEEETALHRQDLLRLIMQVDEIANVAEGVALRISYIKYRPNEYLSTQILDLAKTILKSATSVREAILELAKRSPRVYEICDDIDRTEEEIDSIFRPLEADLFKAFDLDVRIVMQIRSLCYHLEDMGDIAEHVADAIRIIAATRLSA